MSDYSVETLVTNLQAMIKGLAAGVKEAPVSPPEAMNQFPFSLVYVSSFETLGGSSGWDEIIDTITIEIHLARQNLPVNYKAALPYRVQLLKKLIADPTIGGAVDTYTDFRGDFGYLEYAEETHIGWRMQLTVKGKVGC